MRAPKTMCAGASHRAARWLPCVPCHASRRVGPAARSETVLRAAQRRGASAGTPGSGCRRGLDGCQRRGPRARAVGAAGCPPHPAARRAQPRIIPRVVRAIKDLRRANLSAIPCTHRRRCQNLIGHIVSPMHRQKTTSASACLADFSGTECTTLPSNTIVVLFSRQKEKKCFFANPGRIARN